MSNPDDWAKNTRNKLRQKEGAGMRERQESLASYQVLQDGIPQLWNAVQEAFQRFSSSYNKEADRELFVLHSPAPDVFEVRRSDLAGGAGIIVERMGHLINVQWGTLRTVYEVKAPRSDGPARLYQSDKATDPDKIATGALEMFLGL